MTVIIDDILPWTQLIAASGQTVFNTTWTADEATDVVVYARADGVAADDATQLVDPSLYNVTFVGDSELVRVTFTSGRTLNDIITIVRDTPADRDNFYTNTNFSPSMLNGDFSRLTMIDQQNELYWFQIIPRYNTSESPNGDVDLKLPLLGPNQTWVKNSDDTAIETFTLPSSGGAAPDGATYLLQTPNADLPNSFAMSTLSSGLVVNTTATGAQLTRTLQGVSNQISVSNGSGIAGNPTIGIADNPIIPGTAGMGIPEGTTAQRVVPTSSIGMRFNTDFQTVEAYIGGNWVAIPSTAAGIFLLITGGTMTGDIDMDGNEIQNAILRSVALANALDAGGFAITNLLNPSNPQDAATKNYVDTVAAGFAFINPVEVATTANFSSTYNNGTAGVGATLTASVNGAANIDGVALALNDRVLFKDQTAQAENGIYEVTQVGDGSSPAIYTRTTDFDQPSEIVPGDLVPVLQGTVNAGTMWLQTAEVTTIGTDPIQFIAFGADFSNVVTLDGNQTITGIKTFTGATVLGTPASGTLTNCTDLPIGTGVSGLGTGVASALANNVGSAGAVVTFNGALGTPSAGTLTNCDGLVPSSGLDATGTPNATTFLRGDNTWGVPAGSGFSSVVTQVFTASGTYTPTTGMAYCIVECVGGGGGGGGVAASGTTGVGSAGGGAGGYSRRVLSAATIGASQSVTIGAGGAGGTAGANNGTAGGTTSMGALLSATGGGFGAGASGASVSTGATASPGAGGSGSGGNVNTTGGCGGFGVSGTTAGTGGGGAGGNSMYGGGGRPVVVSVSNAAGNAGTGYGSGGSGAACAGGSAANQAGGAGTSGIVIVTEFIA